MAQQQAPRLGGSLVLASLLAALSYVPFDIVAKGSLIVGAILFVLDPIPPITRLVAIASLLVVYTLTKLHNQHKAIQAQEEAEVAIVDTTTTPAIIGSSSRSSSQEDDTKRD